jgi:hypothetical protein
VSGGGGIRTHETLAGLPVFKTGAFNRSATPPCPIATASTTTLVDAPFPSDDVRAGVVLATGYGYIA